MIHALIAGVMLASLLRASAADSPVTSVAKLEFHSSFWLNLHHALFAAAWAQRPDTGQRRLIGPLPAPLTAALSDDERAAWQAAINYYDRTIADRDLRSGPGMTAIKRALAEENLTAEGLNDELRAILQSAAPVYRQHFWLRHDQANRDWIKATASLLRSIEEEIVPKHERLYGVPWFSSPVRVDVVWAGRAYATLNPVTHAVISPSEGSGLTDWKAVEMVLHEACHELILPTEDLMAKALGARTKEHGGMWHAVQFYITGLALQEVLRARQIDYTPYLYSTRLFDRVWPQYRRPIEENWAPCVRGEITRAEAIKRTAAALDP